MAAADESRRKALKATVAALCLEKGFDAVDKASLGVLTEMFQACITEVGRTARTFAELSGRTAPTLPDVEVALADSGLSLRGLEEYSKRPERRHVQKQSTLSSSSTPTPFLTSTKAVRPSSVPDHLPALPNPHTFQRTPCFPKPTSDYQVLRDKMAVQMRDSRRALSRLLSKTRPSVVVIGFEDPGGNYSCIVPTPPKEPAYLLALSPAPKDLQDPGKDEQLDELGDLDDSLDDQTPPPPASCQPPLEECVYLKPPKRMKLKDLQ